MDSKLNGRSRASADGAVPKAVRAGGDGAVTRAVRAEGVPFAERMLTREGKPLKVLSTSLGIALLAGAFIGLSPGSSGVASAETATTAAAAGEPTLLEWSNEKVKSFYDPAVDWNLPKLAASGAGVEEEDEEEEGGAGGSAGGGSGTTVVHTSSGFGWNDLLLYHLIFNRGSSYSSGSWHKSHKSYYPGTTNTYTPKSYTSDSFQNKPVVGSAVRPKTSDSTGSITRRGATSSSPGGIGGTSSGYSGSSSSSSSKSSGGGFGG
ncbi:hypothetical protein ACFO9Q_18250 [Paenibacillus sp. GCM10023252]|uniref:hypothetical protein n=1 Tax=Paenibacillus sp. GCM10023252 TaxID=3252649 RepID=UPI00361478E8